MKNENLYRSLQNFPLAGTGGHYTFLHRLCRENGWRTEYGLRAIDEYKRFVYLAAVSPVPVTPSPDVDQVWHLHLLYTRSYWDALCQGILGKPLHHGPTLGGAAEAAKFDNWYDSTRELYECEFDSAPPTALWPLSFNPDKRYRWTDGARHWVIPKPRFNGGLLSAAPLTLAGTDALPFWVITIVGFLIWIASKIRQSNRPNGKSGSGGDFFFDGGSSDCGDSGGGDCGGGDGGGGCGGGCGGGD